MDLKILQSELSEIESLINNLNLALKSLPTESLNIISSEGKQTFLVVTGKGKNATRRYLSKTETVLIRKLIQKTYFSKLLKKLQKRQCAIKKFTKSYIDSDPTTVYETMHPLRKELVKPFVMSNAMFAEMWQKENYVQNDKYAETKTRKTKRGEYVRSKSEVIIADTLYDLGIPYRYEALVRIGSYKSFYPDFTILDVKSREEIIFEHFGLMDKEEYRNNAFAKIEAYSSAGFHLGKNLLLSFESETHPFNRDYVVQMLEKYRTK